jgi:hypothetical protein
MDGQVLEVLGFEMRQMLVCFFRGVPLQARSPELSAVTRQPHLSPSLAACAQAENSAHHFTPLPHGSWALTYLD